MDNVLRCLSTGEGAMRRAKKDQVLNRLPRIGMRFPPHFGYGQRPHIERGRHLEHGAGDFGVNNGRNCAAKVRRKVVMTLRLTRVS